MGSLVISERTFSQVQEMASTESSTGVMIEGNYRRRKQRNFWTAILHKVITVDYVCNNIFVYMFKISEQFYDG